ncbi:MAG: Nif3-like dinuclear metal center hexameric protein [Pseudomonadota bacterium]
MTSLDAIVRFLNKELKVKTVPDSSRNGLQVRCPKDIKKVGFAVDASLATFEKARRQGVDLLIVHHGIKWKRLRDNAGIMKRRIDFLKKHRINLYVCHLPLDAHHQYGNNIKLAELLGLSHAQNFGRYKRQCLGYQGVLKPARSARWIASILNKKLKAKCVVLGFGRPKVKSVGIVSGGGADALAEAYNEGLDCFITGEAPHHTYHEAKELKMNMIIAGHYETETVGVKALMPLLRNNFAVSTVFIHVPTTF